MKKKNKVSIYFFSTRYFGPQFHCGHEIFLTYHHI